MQAIHTHNGTVSWKKDRDQSSKKTRLLCSSSLKYSTLVSFQTRSPTTNMMTSRTGAAALQHNSRQVTAGGSSEMIVDLTEDGEGSSPCRRQTQKTPQNQSNISSTAFNMMNAPVGVDVTFDMVDLSSDDDENDTHQDDLPGDFTLPQHQDETCQQQRMSMSSKMTISSRKKCNPVISTKEIIDSVLQSAENNNHYAYKSKKRTRNSRKRNDDTIEMTTKKQKVPKEELKHKKWLETRRAVPTTNGRENESITWNQTPKYSHPKLKGRKMKNSKENGKANQKPSHQQHAALQERNTTIRILNQQGLRGGFSQQSQQQQGNQFFAGIRGHTGHTGKQENHCNSHEHQFKTKTTSNHMNKAEKSNPPPASPPPDDNRQKEVGRSQHFDVSSKSTIRTVSVSNEDEAKRYIKNHARNRRRQTNNDQYPHHFKCASCGSTHSVNIPRECPDAIVLVTGLTRRTYTKKIKNLFSWVVGFKHVRVRLPPHSEGARKCQHKFALLRFDTVENAKQAIVQVTQRPARDCPMRSLELILSPKTASGKATIANSSMREKRNGMNPSIAPDMNTKGEIKVNVGKTDVYTTVPCGNKEDFTDHADNDELKDGRKCSLSKKLQDGTSKKHDGANAKRSLIQEGEIDAESANTHRSIEDVSRSTIVDQAPEVIDIFDCDESKPSHTSETHFEVKTSQETAKVRVDDYTSTHMDKQASHHQMNRTLKVSPETIEIETDDEEEEEQAPKKNTDDHTHTTNKKGPELIEIELDSFENYDAKADGTVNVKPRKRSESCETSMKRHVRKSSELDSFDNHDAKADDTVDDKPRKRSESCETSLKRPVRKSSIDSETSNCARRRPKFKPKLPATSARKGGVGPAKKLSAFCSSYEVRPNHQHAALKQPPKESNPATTSSIPNFVFSHHYKYRSHVDYNFSTSLDDAAKEQERLFKLAREKVRTDASLQNAERAPGIFHVPVENVKKLDPSHWKWPNPYSRLGLPPNSSLQLVKKQYRRLALVYHPDKNTSGKDTTLQFQAVTEAYQNLTKH